MVGICDENYVAPAAAVKKSGIGSTAAAASPAKQLHEQAPNSSELELMRAQGVVEQARLDRFKERSRRESEYLGEVEKLIGVEERKRAMVAAISDPALREALARELGVELRQQSTPTSATARPVIQPLSWTAPARPGNGRSGLD
jgi:hypothetical protein